MIGKLDISITRGTTFYRAFTFVGRDLTGHTVRSGLRANAADTEDLLSFTPASGAAAASGQFSIGAPSASTFGLSAYNAPHRFVGFWYLDLVSADDGSVTRYLEGSCEVNP